MRSFIRDRDGVPSTVIETEGFPFRKERKLFPGKVQSSIIIEVTRLNEER